MRKHKVPLVLPDFLQQHHVHYKEAGSLKNIAVDTNIIESVAYTLNIWFSHSHLILA